MSHEDMLQLIEFERVFFDHMIPCDRKRSSCRVSTMSDPLDAAELLDVEMDHLARLLLFIADDRDPLIEGG
jgi:hypothetical protein